MANSKQARTKSSPDNAGIPRGWSEFLGVGLVSLGALMAGGLASFQFGGGTLMGPVGRLAAGALYAGFGMSSYLVVLGVFCVGLLALRGRSMELRIGEGLGFAVATVSACVLMHLAFSTYRVHGISSGGLMGEFVGEVAIGLFDRAGTTLVCLAALVIGLIASTPLDLVHLAGAARFAARAGLWSSRYLWTGATALVAALRDGRGSADEGESEEGSPGSEESEESEAEEEEEDEEEDDEQAERTEEEAETEEDAEDDAAPGPVAAANDPRRAARRAKEELPARTAKEALPEIVLAEVAAGSGDPKGKDGRKKAPLRPNELAQAAREAAALAPLPGPSNSDGSSKRKRTGTGQIVYLRGAYELPPLHLFEAVEQAKTPVDKDFVYQQAERIVSTLAQFRILGRVTKVHPGPVITRYEFKPEAGVKVSKIQNLENDLAMALEAVRIRILAPIPGLATVGFEVPNQSRETVYVQENLADAEFVAARAKLPLVLGKDITGKPVFMDLTKAPHLLVAGATGAGKSVGVNAMLCSLLYACSPEDLRLILIDPKMLEFSVYRDIPHLLLPVITDAEKANLALRWTVEEMDRRYTLLSDAGVRDIAGYNRRLPELQAEWEGDRKLMDEESRLAAQDAMVDGEDGANGPALSGIHIGPDGSPVAGHGGLELPDRPDKMPFIVVVIDEFADLMMVASKEVECNVARIAAKARACGIHLIVATQRPSVDVITGTIKNNFPTRIAFQVTSDIDSRTILDCKGAKQLLGMGDMLYMDRGKEPQRVHGCFVSEAEIEKVVEFVRKQAKPAYNPEITRKSDEGDELGDEDRPNDPLYDKAVQIVAETQKVSTSMLQRRLNVGYNRAAKIVERMEEEGVIGPAQGAKPRDVFVSAA